jgi:tRNA pseudouridine32 synthase / 23S rRNA pseudouridine746 synthase
MCFTRFKTDIEGIALPERFTFPFHYEPHPLSRIAARELQAYLSEQNAWQHDFGLDGSADGLGKMFGVLVVQNTAGELGYLAAFSGKMAGVNHLAHFVPPVFDMLREGGFYRTEEDRISEINRAIEALENASAYKAAVQALDTETNAAAAALEALQQVHKTAKNARAARRLEIPLLSPEDAAQLTETLNRESARHHFEGKDAKRHWKNRVETARQALSLLQTDIDALKEERRRRSAQLQQQLFDQYTFLNRNGEAKSLRAIFHATAEKPPPSGAGECAAPKLLQYAFLNQLTPIALAEFWWGVSPPSEVRQHGHFYPACRGKCEPILGHMLAGMLIDNNPLDVNPAADKDLPVVYEDEYLLAVNKPAGFFSVPGKKIDDSVWSRIRKMYPEATGPLMIHRLDVATSGLLLVAKSKEVHQALQAQFAERQIKKRYVALLNGPVAADSGLIDLPLRVDLDDRPRQLVCYQHGKPAQTRWVVTARTETHTRVHFFPLTGRTHQLRVHAAHPQGLGTPIVGDDLYGDSSDRLYLHAEALEFVHPVFKTTVTIEAAAEF